MHNCIPVQRKLEKLASLSTIIPPARVHVETTREPRSILKKRLVQSFDKVLKITFQHKAALGLQYEAQNLVRKSCRIIYTNDCITVSFSARDFGLRTVRQAMLCVVK